MTSGKKARQERQAVKRPPVRSTGGGRQASPKVLAIVTVAIAVAAIAAVVVFVVAGRGSGSSGSSNLVTTNGATTLPDAGAVTKMFNGIPQHGNVVGKPGAPVTMVQYIDLQCPVCRAFETEVMPTIVARYVRNGTVKVVTRPIAFIGADSETGRRAAMAAGLQNRLSQFTQLMYFNQGPENSGWLTNNLIGAAYASIPGLRSQQALDSKNSSAVLSQLHTFDQQANTDQVHGTPTVFIGKTGGKLTDIAPGGVPDASTVEAAIKRAQGQ